MVTRGLCHKEDKQETENDYDNGKAILNIQNYRYNMLGGITIKRIAEVFFIKYLSEMKRIGWTMTTTVSPEIIQ